LRTFIGKNGARARVAPYVTSFADRTIAALRTAHDQLAGIVPGLTDEQLARQSGASEWPVSQVLSHLGSGAEIARAGYVAGLAGEDAPGQDFNQQVWDRWNALSPREQASGFLEHNEALVTWLEDLSPDDLENLRIKLGFLPEPLPVASVAGMRLHETAQHSWDARVGLDPEAVIDDELALLLFEHLAGDLGFLLRFTGKADQLDEPVRLRIEGTDVSVLVEDHVSISTSAADPTATFHGSPEAALRLLAGRLKEPYVPPLVEVTGNVKLDDLVRVFPGY
jgi:uncharacterized protein (TIGR03083 family)